MPVLASVQLGGFLIFILSGFALGVIYDLISALRLNFPGMKIASSVLDTVFWIIFALIFFAVLQIFQNGEFYFFFLVGAILGFVLYLFTLSKIFLPLLVKTVKLIRRAVSRILNAIYGFFRAILRFFAPIYRFWGDFVQFILKRIMNFVKKTVEIIRRFGVLLKKV